MKKTYESPSVEKIAFQYRDQVVVASTPTLTCTQNWVGLNEESISTCSHTVAVRDSGF